MAPRKAPSANPSKVRATKPRPAAAKRSTPAKTATAAKPKAGPGGKAAAAVAATPLVIIDNSLIDNRGHHLALAKTLTNAAAVIGQSATVYCHKDIDNGLLPATASIVPIFGISVYEVFARKLVKYDMGPEMQAVLDQVEKDFPDGARILFHTADAFTYCAIRDWLVARRQMGREGAPGGQGGYDIHVVTPYEPKLMPGFALKGAYLYKSMHELARWHGPDTRLYFWSETARLAEYLRRAFTMRTAVQTLPAPQWALDRPALNDTASSPRLILNFLGAAREEKGFLHIPDIVAEVARRGALQDKVTFRIHRSAPIVGFSPIVKEAFKKLETYPFVTMVEGALDHDGYAREMHGTDVVLLLYSRANYFARGSGIVVEAMCAGKHMLCMRDTFMQRLPHNLLAFFGETPEEWVDAIETMAADLEGVRSRGRKAGETFTRRNLPEIYLNRLVKREQHSRHFQSIRSVDIKARAPSLVAINSH